MKNIILKFGKLQNGTIRDLVYTTKKYIYEMDSKTLEICIFETNAAAYANPLQVIR